MKSEHFQNEWHDDAQRSPVNEHLILWKREHSEKLQKLSHGKSDRRRAGGQAAAKPESTGHCSDIRMFDVQLLKASPR